MKKGFLFLFIIVFTVLLAACSSDSASPPKEARDSTESLLVEKSNTLLAYLENHDWEALSKEVHPDGLVFTLFANLV